MITKQGPLVAYAVSTAVGSGKTRAAISYMASPDHCHQNFIYVAPTIRLIEQTAEDLRLVIERVESDRDLSLIHSESRQMEGIPVAVETTETINAAEVDSGLVVIITTTTFLRVMSKIKSPEDWRVIIDEGFSPVEFIKVHLGKQADEGLDHFLKNFAIDPVRQHRVIPAFGQSHWVEELASGVLKRSGENNATTQPLAAAVSNPAMVCEMVMSPKAHAILARTYVGPSDEDGVLSRVVPESVLLVACYLTPETLKRFGEVVFMSALFEQTLLYQMWTTLFDVTFIEHPAFPATSMRDIHIDQGMHVSIGHLLHQDDLSSKYNLERNITTGAACEADPGSRVIDHLVRLSSQHFGDSKFLLQTNLGYGYMKGAASMPANAVKLPTSSHGLNEFQEFDNVAALAVTNPIPQEARWIMDKTGLNKADTNMAFRIHTTYQAIGRSSIRKGTPTSDRKTFLTVGQTDALMLHEIFAGSTWLGQVGDMPSLSECSPSFAPETAEWQLSKLILNYLDGVSEDITKVSSRSIKAALTPTCGSSTWTRAINVASENSDDWGARGQSFLRKDGAYFGYVDESGSEVEVEQSP